MFNLFESLYFRPHQLNSSISLWLKLTQQTLKVLAGALLPKSEVTGKVARAIELLVILNLRRKLIIVILGKRIQLVCKGLKPFNNGSADQVGCLVGHLDYDTEAALALDHNRNGPLMVLANDCAAFSVYQLFSSLDMRMPITQRVSLRDLAPSFPTAREALSILLLAAKVLSKRAALSLVIENMLVKRLTADWQLACNLLSAPLQYKQAGCLSSHPGKYCGCIPAFLRTLGCNCAGLLWPVTCKTPIARKLPAVGRFIAIQQFGDLSLNLSGFHKGVDLISFNLAEMFVADGQILLAGQADLNAKHSQAHSLQLMKVALHT